MTTPLSPSPLVPHGVLPSWLSPQDRAGVVGYTVIDYSELPRPSDLAEQLAEMIAHAKCNLEALRRLLDRVGWLKASARLAPSQRPQGRHGDFGEVLSIGMLEAFAGIHVPVVKLRVQMDPEQSLHGSDVVGFHLGLSSAGKLVVEDLEFVEVKCRTTRDKQQAAKAHSQLMKDRDAQFADTIEFLYARLDEIGNDELLEAFEGYLAGRQSDPDGRYRIVLIFDDEAWKGDELDQLPDEADLCIPLTVEVVLVSGLLALIDATWAAVPPVALTA